MRRSAYGPAVSTLRVDDTLGCMYTEPMTHTDQTETVPTITAEDAGCWLDGSQGWHNTHRVIYLARDYGFALVPEDVTLIERYATGESWDDIDLAEIMSELSNEATDHLQSLAPEGYSFVWDDGLYLWADDDTDENGGWIGE